MAAADSSLIVSEPLCFLFKKYGRYSVTDMKSLLYNFYSSAQLAIAKQALADILAQKKLESAQKLLRRRRDSRENPDAKIRHDIDDIMAVIAHIAEQKLIDQLPTFVAANPDLLPSSRFCDGDILAIFQKIERLEDRFSTIQQELDTTRSLLVRTLATNGARGDMGGSGGTGGGHTMSLIGGEGRGVFGGISDGPGPTGAASAKAVMSHSTWADAENSSARESERDDDSDFTLPASRNARRAAKRLRASETPPPASQAIVVVAGASNARSYASATAKPATKPKSSHSGKRNILIGQSTNCSIKASKNLNLPKAIYRIGNVDPGYTPELLTQYIESLDIRVLSCFDRTSQNTRYTENKSFRVCIPDVDKEKLLCANSWSVGITISRWVFKPKADPFLASKETGGDSAEDRHQEGATGGEKETTEGEKGADMERDESETGHVQGSAETASTNG